MPVFDDILENKVLGREFKRGFEEGLRDGELKILRRQITAWFGPIPPPLDERLSKLLPSELEDYSVRLIQSRINGEPLPY